MIHYHGTPITPRAELLRLAGRCFCVRYGEHRARQRVLAWIADAPEPSERAA